MFDDILFNSSLVPIWFHVKSTDRNLLDTHSVEIPEIHSFNFFGKMSSNHLIHQHKFHYRMSSKSKILYFPYCVTLSEMSSILESEVNMIWPIFLKKITQIVTKWLLFFSRNILLLHTFVKSNDFFLCFSILDPVSQFFIMWQQRRTSSVFYVMDERTLFSDLVSEL